MNDSHLDGKERFMKNEDIFLFTCCLFFFGELSYFVKKYLLSLPHCTQTFAVVWCAFSMTSLYKVSIQVGLNTCKCFPPKVPLTRGRQMCPCKNEVWCRFHLLHPLPMPLCLWLMSKDHLVLQQKCKSW